MREASRRDKKQGTEHPVIKEASEHEMCSYLVEKCGGDCLKCL